jgi:flagellar biosynthetic protein FliQ
MNEAIIVDITRDAIFTLVKMVAPMLLIAMTIGLIVGIFQALTQIQEMTLAFVPKIIAVFVSLIFLLPFMIGEITEFSQHMYDRIISLS